MQTWFNDQRSFLMIGFVSPSRHCCIHLATLSIKSLGIIYLSLRFESNLRDTIKKWPHSHENPSISRNKSIEVIYYPSCFVPVIKSRMIDVYEVFANHKASCEDCRTELANYYFVTEYCSNIPLSTRMIPSSASSPLSRICSTTGRYAGNSRSTNIRSKGSVISASLDQQIGLLARKKCRYIFGEKSSCTYMSVA